MRTSEADVFTVRNPVRERIAANEVAFGIGVRAIRSGEIARLAAATEHDFLYIDTQHAVFNPREIAEITSTALGVGVAPFVRVRSATDPDISLYLDSGVLGIVAPDIDSADQARQLVDVVKYAPIGHRSLSGFTPHSWYRPVPAAEVMRAENDAIMLLCMIESRAGLDAIEEIAAVPGLDGLYIGFADLLADLGTPGDFDGPAVAEALRLLADVTARHGLVAGSGGAPTPSLQLRAIRAGVRFLMSSSDLGLIRTGARAARERILAGLAESAGTTDTPNSERSSR